MRSWFPPPLETSCRCGARDSPRRKFMDEYEYSFLNREPIYAKWEALKGTDFAPKHEKIRLWRVGSLRDQEIQGCPESVVAGKGVGTR